MSQPPVGAWRHVHCEKCWKTASDLAGAGGAGPGADLNVKVDRTVRLVGVAVVDDALDVLHHLMATHTPRQAHGSKEKANVAPTPGTKASSKQNRSGSRGR